MDNYNLNVYLSGVTEISPSPKNVSILPRPMLTMNRGEG